MTTTLNYAHNPKLDLILDRTVDVPRHLVWAAWTKPEHLKKWFCPAPWTVSACEIDLRAGGAFNTTMAGPNGEVVENLGCYLEVVDGERLVFTDGMTAGFRLADKPFFVCILTLDDVPGGTRYIARAMHKDPETRGQHEAMGFMDGWSAALDQLVALAKTM